MKKQTIKRQLQKMERASLFCDDLVFEIKATEDDEEVYHAPNRKQGMGFTLI